MAPKKETAPKTRRPSNQTQWAAQFAVASELCRRGYEVSFTTGNNPCVDLMVSSPKHRQFSVDVKGLHKANYWPVRKQAPRTKLFYVLAFVPTDAPCRFFVLTQQQVNRGIHQDFQETRSRKKKKGLRYPKNLFPAVGWKYAKNFEDAWTTLPE